MIKKVMVVASLSAIVGGGVYYFLVSPNIKENTVLTTKVNPTIESEVQGNIEEKEEQQIDYASISQKLDQYLGAPNLLSNASPSSSCLTLTLFCPGGGRQWGQTRPSVLAVPPLPSAISTRENRKSH